MDEELPLLTEELTLLEFSDGIEIELDEKFLVLVDVELFREDPDALENDLDEVPEFDDLLTGFILLL